MEGDNTEKESSGGIFIEGTYYFTFLASCPYNELEVVTMKMLTTQIGGLLQRIATKWRGRN